MKKKKYKIRKGRVAGAVIILLALVTSVIVIVSTIIGKNKNKQQPDSGKASVSDIETNANGEYLKIEMEDCNLYVGTVLKLRCSSNPEEYASQVMWNSTNSDIVSVDQNGTITVRAQGLSAITATFGTLSDSIVINAVNKEDGKVDIKLPVYEIGGDGQLVLTETAYNPGNEDTESDDADAPSSTEPDQSDDTDVDTEGDTTGQPPQETDYPETETDTVPVDVQIETEQVFDKEESKNSVLAKIYECGLQQYLDDTFIIAEDDNYLGEVIVNNDYVQIYVMTRTYLLDDYVKQLIQVLLPGTYNDVYGEFVSAVMSKTYSSGGRRVRIIAPDDGGHSQLIIYY